MWQALRTELRPKGLEIVTVALDSGGPDAASPFVEAAGAEHPSLIDVGHRVAEALGIVNVPSGVWIGEDGVIVRPAEPAWARDPGFASIEAPPDADERTLRSIAAVKALRIEADRYVGALRDWAEHGRASRFALRPDEVVRRSLPRDRVASEASACFELGVHLHRGGEPQAAIAWFRRAHELHPESWTAKRQAWTLNGTQGRSEAYDGSWLDDVMAAGPEHYYPPLDLER